MSGDYDLSIFIICRYEVDSAASPPCYRLVTKSDEDRSDEERRVLAVFQKILSVEMRDAYLTTVVEQEVHNTVLMSQELARRCLWINRVTVPTQGKQEQDTPGEKELQRRLANLQKDLKVINPLWSENVLFTAHI